MGGQGSITVGGQIGIAGQPMQGQIGGLQPAMQGQEFTYGIQQGQIGGSYQGQIVGGQVSMPGQVVQGIPQATYTQGSGAVTPGVGYQIAGQPGYVTGAAGYTQYPTTVQAGYAVQGSTYTPRGQNMQVNMQVQGQTSSSYTPPANYTYAAPPGAEITYAAPPADATYGVPQPIGATAVTPEIVMAQPVQPQNEGLLAADSMLCYTSGPQVQLAEGQEKEPTTAKKDR